jgi:hypothetical protein
MPSLVASLVVALPAAADPATCRQPDQETGLVEHETTNPLVSMRTVALRTGSYLDPDLAYRAPAVEPGRLVPVALPYVGHIPADNDQVREGTVSHGSLAW